MKRFGYHYIALYWIYGTVELLEATTNDHAAVYVISNASFHFVKWRKNSIGYYFQLYGRRYYLDDFRFIAGTKKPLPLVADNARSESR